MKCDHYPLIQRLSVLGLLLCPLASPAAVTLNGFSSSPWNLTGGDSAFSATVTDSAYNGGTNADFSFADPKDGVDISDPDAPDDSSATNTVFGVEGTGFGVYESYVGRFNRGESFTLEADHAFQLNSIRWAEYTGDESINITWTSGGVAMSETFDFTSGSFYTTTPFNQLLVDANTTVTITNVSDSSSYLGGRLRVNEVSVSLMDDIESVEVGETHQLDSWSSSPWNLSGGDPSFSGSVNDTANGSVTVDFLDPMTGVDVSTPGNPDFSGASNSYFGVEGTGFGVGESGVGRFNRGESFVMQADQAFELQSIRWAEYSGDESLYMTWTSDGVPMSTLIDLPSGSFYTETSLGGIVPDANTPLEITNVSASGSSMSGRLRVNHIDVAFVTASSGQGETDGAYLILAEWEEWPWNAVGGDSTIEGVLNAPENGGTPMDFTFTAYTGVDASDPNNPDFSGASVGIFGFEPTGLGVGNTTLGRFNTGEAITIECDHDFRIDNIRWREAQGDEQLHLSYTSGGVAQNEVVTVPGGSQDFADLVVDANTTLTITNVSPSSSSLNGRLRLTDIKIRGVFSSEPSYDFSGPDGFVPMTGVNLAGAEFGGFAFWQKNPDEWDYYNSKGLNLIRVPFKWERIQSSLYGSVDFSDLDDIIDLADARGMKVILDMHNYARYNGDVIGTTNVPNAAFEDVWRKIADHYKNETCIYGYGIMNEPHGTGGLWPAAAQAAADGIRDVDSNNWIIVGGESYSSASAWRDVNPNLDVNDPQDKVMYEAHVYFDTSWPAGDGSYGSYGSENPAVDRGVRLMNPFILWLQEKGYRGFVGEYGVPKNDIRWNPLLDEFMSHITSHGLSGTYWAGGENWNNYPLDCSPTNNYTTDSNQMIVLEQYGD